MICGGRATIEGFLAKPRVREFLYKLLFVESEETSGTK